MKYNKFKIYQDSKKEWRWTLTASNGRILADSGEGYKRKQACLRAIKATQKPHILSWDLE